MRLDKLLANMGYGSRKDVKQLLKKNHVTVNHTIIKNGSVHVDPVKDVVEVEGEQVIYREFIYIMMNKPQGYISATTDDRDRTVIDILSSNYHLYDPFPVGRLDKDTEGLLLITNDGRLAHDLTSPKKDIEKTYYAKIQGEVNETDQERFQQGVVLEDGYKAKPAKLDILNSDTTSEIEVTITEGKYHQVKRMFEAVDKRVMYLQRQSMGPLYLDQSLKLGSYRELTEEERDACLALKKS